MDIKVIKIKDGDKDCGICKGTGYYTTHTDRAGEDGGEYTNRYPCQCNKNNIVPKSCCRNEERRENAMEGAKNKTQHGNVTARKEFVQWFTKKNRIYLKGLDK